MKLIRSILLILIVAAPVWAGDVVDVLEVDGVKYESVTFGPVNQGKIVLYHNQGSTTVPLASLPPEYQERFTAKPDAAPINSFLPVPREVQESRSVPSPVIVVREPTSPSTPVVTPAPTPVNPPSVLDTMRAKRVETVANTTGKSDWADYNHDRAKHLLLDGKLVDKSSLTPLVGFLARERASITDDERTYNGAALDLAEPKAKVATVPTAMELRPSLWERTDERVFLLDYKPESMAGVLMQIYGIEVAQIGGWRTFKIAREPGFEEWKRLAR